jgi:sec-independent protein translocase protein TatA
MFGDLLQPTHLLLILVIVLIIFGAGKLPEAFGAVGKGIKEFRDAASGTNAEKDAKAEEEQADNKKQSS